MSHFTQVFIEHLLWIRCCSRGWRYRSERIEQSRCPLRAFWYEGGSKYISENLGIRGRVYWGERVYNLKYIGHGRHHWVGNIQWGRLGMGHVSREQRPQAGVSLVQTGAVRRTEAWVPRVLEGEGGTGWVGLQGLTGWRRSFLPLMWWMCWEASKVFEQRSNVVYFMYHHDPWLLFTENRLRGAGSYCCNLGER